MRWKLVTWITLVATYFSNVLIRQREQPYTFEAFGEMPKQSLGSSFYRCLVGQQLKFRPNLIRHDIKHVLLDYKMTMPDELRICAFMLGNKSQNSLSMAYLFLCTAIVPEIIPLLKKDYKRGKKSGSLKNLNIKVLAPLSVDQCRRQLNIHPLIN